MHFSGLERLAGFLEQHASPCIRISHRACPDAEVPVAASKFGGLPDVDAQFLWPGSSEGPLCFLCQINLGEAKALDRQSVLPESGLLLVFYGFPDCMWDCPFRCIHYDKSALGALARCAHQPDGMIVLPSSRMAFHDALSLPSLRSFEVLTMNLSRKEQEHYQNLQRRLFYGSDAPCAADAPWHQLLGHPQELQHDLRMLFSFPGPAEDGMGLLGEVAGEDPESFLTRLEEEDEDEFERHLDLLEEAWRGVPTQGEPGKITLLFQLDTDEDLGVTYGDSGRLYGVLAPAELQAGRFEETCMVVQAY